MKRKKEKQNNPLSNKEIRMLTMHAIARNMRNGMAFEEACKNPNIVAEAFTYVIQNNVLDFGSEEEKQRILKERSDIEQIMKSFTIKDVIKNISKNIGKETK